ncbi:hypothetical protein GCM10027614_26280 [Micromonospora vulcania]
MGAPPISLMGDELLAGLLARTAGSVPTATVDPVAAAGAIGDPVAGGSTAGGDGAALGGSAAPDGAAPTAG